MFLQKKYIICFDLEKAEKSLENENNNRKEVEFGIFFP